MKVNPFKIIPFSNVSGSESFRVTGMLNGKQVRKNFSTMEEAVAEKQRLECELANIAPPKLVHTDLTPEQAKEAEWAFRQLNGRSMIQAINYFIANYTDPLKKSTLQAGYDLFIADKERENNRPLTIRNLKTRIGFLVKAHGAKLISDIQPEQIRDIIYRAGRSPVTQDNDRRAISSFFNWATEQGYCAKNPMQTIKPIKTDREEPSILPLAKAKTLLHAAASYKDGVCLPYVVLGMFCAIRPTELERLTWDEIDLKTKTVTIGAKLAKMRQRRLVSIPKNAVAWLSSHAADKTPIKGVNWRRDFDAIKEAAGYGTSTEKKKLEPWIPDIMRHTGISHHLAKYQHEGKTATWAGNSPDVIQKHYKGLVRAKDTKAFWNLMPAAAGKIISLKAA